MTPKHQSVQTMGVQQFFDWLDNQNEKYELVDGRPVMMAGANKRHDRIVTSALLEIGNQLKGRPCHPCSSDIAIQISSGNIRYPDLSVDCGQYHGDERTAAMPKLVVEVASRSTRQFDNNEKLEEYKSVATLQYILLVNPDVPRVRFYFRQDASWSSQSIIGVESSIPMPAIGVTLALKDLYQGLPFDEEANSSVS